MIKLPKNAKAGNRNDDLWSFVDLAPTVLQLANIPLPDYLQGISILDKKTKPRKYLVTASDRFDGQVDRIRSIKTKRFKFIKNYNVSLPHALDVNYRKKMPMMRRLMVLSEKGLLDKNAQRWFDTPKAEIEFYDLQKDPFELNNLAEEASYSKKLRKFNSLLEDWMINTRDLGGLPEQEIIDYSVN